MAELLYLTGARDTTGPAAPDRPARRWSWTAAAAVGVLVAGLTTAAVQALDDLGASPGITAVQSQDA